MKLRNAKTAMCGGAIRFDATKMAAHATPAIAWKIENASTTEFSTLSFDFKDILVSLLGWL